MAQSGRDSLRGGVRANDSKRIDEVLYKSCLDYS